MAAFAWLLAFGLCGNAWADGAIGTWRSEATLARMLAENDAPAAYKEAQRLQTTLPADATPVDRARLLNLLSRAEVYLALTDKAALHAQQAFDIAKLYGDRVEQVEADLNVAVNAINQSRLDAMFASTFRAMNNLEGVDRPDLLVQAMLRTSMMYRRMERFDESIAMAVQTLEIAKRSHNNPMALAYAYQGMAISYDSSTRYAESRDYYLRMLEQARLAHSRQLEGSALLGYGFSLTYLGDMAAGERLARQAIDIFRAAGMPFYISRGQYMLADILRKQGRLSESLLILDEVVEIYVRGSNKIGLWWTLNARSKNFQALGRIEQAQADAVRAYNLAKSIGFATYQAESARRMAAMAAVHGDYKRSYEYFVEATEMTTKAAQEKSGEQMIELAERYEEKSRQQQIEELTRRNEQQHAEIRQRTLQQRWLWTLVVSGGVLFAITVFFLLRLRRSSEEIRVLNTGLEQRVLARTAELRQQTRYLRTLIDMLPVMTWLKDTQSRFLTVNRAVAEAAGQPPNALIGKTDLDFFPREIAEASRADDAEVMSTRQDKVVEDQIAGPQGNVWIETYKAPVLDEDGTLLGTVGIARDITESKALAEAREAALAEAQRLARMRSEFLAQMSHELRTPLNGILGYAQVLRRNKNLDERQVAGLNVIQQSGEHLLTLINDILDSAKIEAGKQELHIDDIPLRRFLRTITEIIGVKTELKRLELVRDFAPDLPDVIRADEKRLRQVLLNLLANAVKFTDHGQVGLHVRFLPPSRLCFEVRDSGIGIAEKDLKTIFQPFEQVGEVQHRFGGTGLGLAISRQFVQLMGSDIEVESNLGQGSVFRFVLEVPVVHGATATAPVRVVNGYLGARKKVLVVDDLAENRAVLLDMLGQIGFEMSEATNGREGIEQAQLLHPDLILMDVFMPEMNGLEATKRLRQLPAFEDVPIIAISASASGSDEDSCLAVGMSAFLPKPVVMDRLLSHVAHLLKLDWTSELSEADKTPPQASAVPMSVPPQEEMEILHRMALQGNMRDIVQMATRLTGLDECYRAFADQLLLMARGYQSKALLSFVERHLDRKQAS